MSQNGVGESRKFRPALLPRPTIKLMLNSKGGWKTMPSYLKSIHVSSRYLIHATKHHHWIVVVVVVVFLSVTTAWGGCWFDSQKSCDLWPLEMCSWRVSNYHIILLYRYVSKNILTVRLLRKRCAKFSKKLMEFGKDHRFERRLHHSFYSIIFPGRGFWGGSHYFSCFIIRV